jgi:hypothetical protein
LAETLTESFCERCGTRYEFNAPTRLNPLRKTRGLVGGLKNYLTSQDALGDAIGDAMRSEEEGLAAAQLDAFHESFNFCIDCRQYTCVNCWNDAAGRCRSCAPIAGTDDLLDRMQASLGAPAAIDVVADTVLAGNDLQRRLGMDAWPESDLAPATNGHGPADVAATEAIAESPDAVGGREPVGADEVEPAAADATATFEVEGEIPWPAGAPSEETLEAYAPADEEPFEYAVAEGEPVVAEEVEPEPVVTEVDAEPIAAELEPGPVAAQAESHLRILHWDADAAYDIEPLVAEVEPEPEPVVAEVEPEAEPVVAEVEPEPEPVVAEVEPEAEPVVADVEPEAEPVVAEVEPEAEPVVADVEPEAEPSPRRPITPISETILRMPVHQPAPQSIEAPDAEPAMPAAAQADDPQVAARRAQLDLLGLGDPGEGPLGPERPNVLPYRSRGSSASAAEIAALAAAGRPISFWEASANEVAGAAVGVQNCGQCGLSLSANARFCRRCGTRQAQSA